MARRTLIAGGLVVGATASFHGDVLVSDGRVAAAPPRGELVARARQGESLALRERAPGPVVVTV